MKNDKHLINETEYAAVKKANIASREDFMLSAIGAFERMVDTFTELSDKYDELSIDKIIYKHWNKVAKDTGYSKMGDVTRHLVDYLLAKHWLFGDVFSGMIRDGEIKSDGKCIGHSLDAHEW